MCGNQKDSRTIIQSFCSSVLNFPISLGAIQKIVDRTSAAINPHYEAIAEVVRKAPVNNVDETSWCQNGALMWLWVLACPNAALFMLHSRRSGEAFKALIQDWTGILISDGYGVYRNWVGQRQTCLSHLIRDAVGLSESPDPELAKFGIWAAAELQRLCHMANAPPTIGQWRAFYARFINLIARNRDRKDAAGKFARRLEREMDSLWTFLHEEGVTPTNNFAERMLRFAVIWRKCSQGTRSEKGNRWVERILSLRQTCRLLSKPTFPVLVEAIRCHFQGLPPDTSLIISK
jgi:transposase